MTFGVHFPFLAVLLTAGLTVIHRQAHSRRLDVAGHVAFRVLLGGMVCIGVVWTGVI